jgi:hypothetical protein
MGVALFRVLREFWFPPLSLKSYPCIIWKEVYEKWTSATFYCHPEPKYPTCLLSLHVPDTLQSVVEWTPVSILCLSQVPDQLLILQSQHWRQTTVMFLSKPLTDCNIGYVERTFRQTALRSSWSLLDTGGSGWRSLPAQRHVAVWNGDLYL